MTLLGNHSEEKSSKIKISCGKISELFVIAKYCMPKYLDREIELNTLWHIYQMKYKVTIENKIK